MPEIDWLSSQSRKPDSMGPVQASHKRASVPGLLCVRAHPLGSGRGAGLKEYSAVQHPGTGQELNTDAEAFVLFFFMFSLFF